MQKPFNFKTVKFSALESLAVIAQNQSVDLIMESLINIKNNPNFSGKAWQSAINKTMMLIQSGFTRVPFKVFAKGNSKLPFYSFSVLPGVTCPGAGECLSFCYSPKAWRYPSAYFRQLQNSLLLRFSKRVILKAVSSIPKGSTVRLYVDGDFDSLETIGFWNYTFTVNPELSFYGYSKSLELIAEYTTKDSPIASNYKLNLSSGHNASNNTVNVIKTLPIYRGDFVAVNIGKKVKSTDYGTKPVNDAIRAKFTDKVFPCPGKCGTCTSIGHACGSDKFTGKIIAIAVH